jgi:hypothetical protein
MVYHLRETRGNFVEEVIPIGIVSGNVNRIVKTTTLHISCEMESGLIPLDKIAQPIVRKVTLLWFAEPALGHQKAKNPFYKDALTI